MQGLIDFATDNAQTGFRLQQFEVLNWGTFDRKIWKLEPAGFNSLLTGDIGSGKSTLVDALTTLLVPHQKITYNKAAGAESRERTRYSYIRGEYKNRKDELTNRSMSVYLREEDVYSVLLAYFYNQGYGQGITIAQVFWIKNNRDEKFFLISEQKLGINEHFTKFGSEMPQLKKRLRKLPETEVFDAFSDYSSRFRNIFGIQSDKALDLFYQTVSMKSVGNLTDFVRNHMLEKSDVKDRIEELKRNFENLTKAHEAVLKAKKQLQYLQPLAAEAEEFEGISREVMELQKCIEAIPVCFAVEKTGLLKSEIERLAGEHDMVKNKIDELAKDLEELRRKERELNSAIDNNAEGRRLNEIIRVMAEKDEAKKQKAKEAEKYESLVNVLGLPKPENEEIFYQARPKAKVMEKYNEEEFSRLREEWGDLKGRQRNLRDRLKENNDELESLKQRKTQIPETNLRLRSALLKDLALNEFDLPFAGELILVKKEAKDWEGAIERLLHNFGLSILVPEREYKRVSGYVNRTNLRGRLIYFKVPSGLGYRKTMEIDDNSLPRKIEIKSDSAFYDWLENELDERFNYVCCETIEQFQREPYAVTKEGQVRSGKLRHEKDDRKDIFDRRNYVLGWSNIEKIRAIENEMLAIRKELGAVEKTIDSNERKQKELDIKKICLHDFLKYTDYSQINWKKDAAEIQKLIAEKEELEKSSDQLKKLKEQLSETMTDIKAKDEGKSAKEKRLGQIEQGKTNCGDNLVECSQAVASMTEAEKEVYFPKVLDYLKDAVLNLKTIDHLQSNTRKQIDGVKDRKIKAGDKLRDGIISRMQKYKNEYPAETTEADASIEAIPEFKRFLKKIEGDDLPRHEKRFKELLNEGTINDIAIFKNQLETSEKDIRVNINKINKSLKDIEYNPGRFIQLVPDSVHDIEIRDFKLQLRICLENTLGETEIYNEEKFNQVKKILDRFNSGAQADINWTNKVADVRNWFEFNASIRFAETNEQDEFISDSSGKSGGQKEKLAYTVLASALAYKFGLEWNQKRSRSFRFVVIDEAFGRGSDESTRYGLELFKKLNLQLLIVTPLQKINIIEDYVNAVHFVSNRDGSSSEALNLTKQQYLENKEKYLRIIPSSSLNLSELKKG